MACKVKSFFKGGSSHGNTKYPWEVWSDGNIWEVVKGKDFDCTTQSLIGAAWNYAARNGLKVTVRTRKKLGIIRMKFWNPALVEDDNPPAEKDEASGIADGITSPQHTLNKAFEDVRDELLARLTHPDRTERE